MTIAMIIFSFLLGGTIVFVAMKLSYNQTILQMQSDTVDAIAKQAQDSYEAGYMRNEIERSWRKRKLKKMDETHLIPVQR